LSVPSKQVSAHESIHKHTQPYTTIHNHTQPYTTIHKVYASSRYSCQKHKQPYTNHTQPAPAFPHEHRQPYTQTTRKRIRFACKHNNQPYTKHRKIAYGRTDTIVLAHGILRAALNCAMKKSPPVDRQRKISPQFSCQRTLLRSAQRQSSEAEATVPNISQKYKQEIARYFCSYVSSAPGRAEPG
jgi:hypothetical protein